MTARIHIKGMVIDSKPDKNAVLVMQPDGSVSIVKSDDKKFRLLLNGKAMKQGNWFCCSGETEPTETQQLSARWRMCRPAMKSSRRSMPESSVGTVIAAEYMKPAGVSARLGESGIASLTPMDKLSASWQRKRCKRAKRISRTLRIFEDIRRAKPAGRHAPRALLCLQKKGSDSEKDTDDSSGNRNVGRSGLRRCRADE